MARIPLSGHNDEALVDDGTDARCLLTDASGNNVDFDGDSRLFELQALTVANEHATQTVILEVWDDDEGANPAAADQKLTIIVPPNDVVQLTWARGTGPRFATGIVGSADGAVGTINIGGVHASGELI